MAILVVGLVALAGPGCRGACYDAIPYVRAEFAGTIQRNGLPEAGTPAGDLWYEGAKAQASVSGEGEPGSLVAELSTGLAENASFRLKLVIPVPLGAPDSFSLALYDEGLSPGFHGMTRSTAGIGLLDRGQPVPLLVDGFVRVLRVNPIVLDLDIRSHPTSRASYRIRGTVTYRSRHTDPYCEPYS